VWSPIQAITTAATLPACPVGLKLGQVTRTAVSLSWSPPDDDGGSPVTGYEVGADAVRAAHRLVGPYALCQAVTRLLPASTPWGARAACNHCRLDLSRSSTRVAPAYIYAFMEGGQGLAAAGLNSVTLAAALQVQLLAVSKIAVRDLGQDWLTIYQGAGLGTNWSALRAGCKYQLRVAACNSVGFSQFSIPVSFMTQPDAPLSPAKPTALCESRVSAMHGVVMECSGLGVELHNAAIAS